MPTKLERVLVTERAEARCEYCRAPQVITGGTYHIEHIIPLVRGGADDPGNYALSCVACNGHKAAHITGLDPVTAKEVPLFNPRQDRWDRHFSFSKESLEVTGTSSKGRATVRRLLMNEPRQIQARSLWVQLDLFP